MAKKIFTDESLSTLVSEIKGYTDSAVSTKANKTHDHAISDVSGLQSALDGKSALGHTHNISEVNELSSTLNNLYTKNEIDNMVFVSVDDIDAICNTSIAIATLDCEVKF